MIASYALTNEIVLIWYLKNVLHISWSYFFLLLSYFIYRRIIHENSGIMVFQFWTEVSEFHYGRRKPIKQANFWALVRQQKPWEGMCCKSFWFLMCRRSASKRCGSGSMDLHSEIADPDPGKSTNKSHIITTSKKFSIFFTFWF